MTRVPLMFFLVIQRRPVIKVADLSGRKAKAHFFKGFSVLKNTAGILNSVVRVFLIMNRGSFSMCMALWNLCNVFCHLMLPGRRF